jgi:hypothetical protein
VAFAAIEADRIDCEPPKGVRSRLLGELSQPLGIPLRSSSGRDTVRYWQILLQKSFRGGEQKFLEPLMRLARGDVRDHIASSKINHDLRSGVEERHSSREVQRSTFARFLGLFDFRLLQQNRHFSDISDLAGDVRFRVKSRLAIIRFATGCFWRKAPVHRHVRF